MRQRKKKVKRIIDLTLHTPVRVKQKKKRRNGNNDLLMQKTSSSDPAKLMRQKGVIRRWDARLLERNSVKGK